MTFRPATPDDAAIAYQWRQRAEAQPWWNGTPTTWNEHREWFAERINNPTLLILMWNGGEGIVRLDSNGELAFDADDLATARQMLEQLKPSAAAYGGRLKATLDRDDPKHIALEAAGFTQHPVRFYTYRP